MKALFFILILASIALGYNGGDGSEAAPYIISSTNDLMQLRDTIGDYSKAFILNNDIDLAAADFPDAIIAPSSGALDIYEGTPFTGQFDGNGFAIKNFFCTQSERDFLGLFGQIASSGVIKNLGVENCEVLGYNNLGCLVGENFGSISNSYALGKINGAIGLGLLMGRNDGGVVVNCYAQGEVYGHDLVGVMCGEFLAGIIMRSYASGNVDASGSYAGILCGYSLFGDIFNSYADGNVEAQEYAAVLCGNSDFGIISNSYANGNVNALNHAGVLCANNNYIIASSFWNLNSVSPTNDLGRGLTSLEMQNPATFTDAGWDFSHIWRMSTNAPFFPKLQLIAIESVPAPIAFFPDFSSITTTSFVARWSAPYEAIGYKLYVFEAIGTNVVEKYYDYATTSLFQEISELDTTKPYSYQVRAVYENEKISARSNKITVVIPEPSLLFMIALGVLMAVKKRS